MIVIMIIIIIKMTMIIIIIMIMVISATRILVQLLKVPIAIFAQGVTYFCEVRCLCGTYRLLCCVRAQALTHPEAACSWHTAAHTRQLNDAYGGLCRWVTATGRGRVEASLSPTSGTWCVSSLVVKS